MAETPEMKAFRSCMPVLEKGLNADEVTLKLFSAGVITRKDRGKIQSKTVSYEKVNELLTAVETNLSTNPSNYSVFVAAVRSVPSYRKLAQILEDELAKAKGEVRGEQYVERHPEPAPIPQDPPPSVPPAKPIPPPVVDPGPVHKQPYRYAPQVWSQQKHPVETDSPLEGQQEVPHPLILQYEGGDRKRIYNVTTRKSHALAVIFNNKNFSSKSRLCKRPESKHDVDRLERVLRDLLGFEVVKYEDKTSDEIKGLFGSKFEGKIRQDHDSIFCCVMSHGRKDGICGINNETVTPEELMPCLDGSECEELLGKPKIMIIHCCRGGDAPEPKIYKAEGGPSTQVTVSPHADFICAYTTTFGAIATLGDEGAPYIQSLCKVLETNVEERMGWSLNYMLCLVNQRLSEEGAQDVKKDGKTCKFVQTGQVEHTLRDFVFFHTE